MSFACRTVRGVNTTSAYNGQSVTHSNTGGVSSTVGFINDGSVISTGAGGANFASDWFLLHATGVGSFYWLRWTLLSGSVWSATPGASGIWIPMTSNLFWTLTVVGVQDHFNDTLFEIAGDSGGAGIVCSGHITAEADGT